MDWKKELVERLNVYPAYQESLRALQALEPAYVALRTALTEEQRQLLDSYISACEEMDDIMQNIAYQLGWEHGSKQNPKKG